MIFFKDNTNIDRKIINKNNRYTNINEIIDDRYMHNLFSFIKNKQLFYEIIECPGNYTTDNQTQLWLAYGTNKQKVKDESLSSHIREAFKSLNPDTDFCLDLNLYKITDSDTYLLHQDVVRNINLIELITKCFNESGVAIPDRISIYDALAIEAFYIETSESLLNSPSKNNKKNYNDNLNLIKHIINSSSSPYNPLSTKYNQISKKTNKLFFFKSENLRNILFGSFVNQNKVSAETVIKNSNKIYSCEINVSIAKKMQKKLKFYKNIPYFCSKPTPPKCFKYSISKHIPRDLYVCNFIIPETFKSEFRYLYYSIKYPNGFNHSLTELKRNGDITFLCIPEKDYLFYEKLLISEKVPFLIGYKHSDFDIDKICIYYNTQYTFSLIEIMHMFADATAESGYSNSLSLNENNFYYSAMKKIMEDNPNMVIK